MTIIILSTVIPWTYESHVFANPGTIIYACLTDHKCPYFLTIIISDDYNFILVLSLVRLPPSQNWYIDNLPISYSKHVYRAFLNCCTQQIDWQQKLAFTKNQNRSTYKSPRHIERFIMFMRTLCPSTTQTQPIKLFLVLLNYAHKMIIDYEINDELICEECNSVWRLMITTHCCM